MPEKNAGTEKIAWAKKYPFSPPGYSHVFIEGESYRITAFHPRIEIETEGRGRPLEKFLREKGVNVKE